MKKLSHFIKFIFCTVVFCICFFSCEKEIEIKLKNNGYKLVVEGRIEGVTDDNNFPFPPVIVLTKSVGYFEPTDINTFENLFIHNAIVTITVDNITTPLSEICLSDLPPNFAPYVADFFGIPAEDISTFNYCFYTVPLDSFFTGNYLHGEVGKTYHLNIESEGKTYSSSTTIPGLVPLDSTWFQVQKDDTLGFAWAKLTDPGNANNYYRWFAKRISHNVHGEEKDAAFVAPFGSAFDDKFINGISFNFAYDRGHPPGIESDEPGEVAHYFKVGDTVVVKFCTIDKGVYDFLRVYEIDINSNGSPFASPSTIPTNIVGGALGVWAGYGVTYDTLVANP